MTKSERVNLYLTTVKQEGYLPEIDKDGDIKFKSEGRTFYLIVEEKDENFISILYPNFWEIENDQERSLALKAADEANARAKVAKIHLMKDNVWAAVEILLPNPESFGKVFPRCVLFLGNAIRHFLDQMR